MEADKKEVLKKRTIKYVNQTQVGCEKAVCLADHCRKNPGTVLSSDYKPISRESALQEFITMSNGVASVWLCDDDGEVGDFSNKVISTKVQVKDWEFFQEEYPRFLARVENLGTGFTVDGGEDYKSRVNFALIRSVCDVLQDMPVGAKKIMISNLKTYRVRYGLPRN